MNKKDLAPVAMLGLSLVALSRFSQGVRSVAVLGLFASGLLAGTSLTRLLIAWKHRRG
jgi:hypothetical protein